MAPFYNVEGYVEACRASLAAQTFVHREILCITDGFIDETPRILARFAGIDPRILVYRIVNVKQFFPSGYCSGIRPTLTAFHCINHLYREGYNRS